MGVTGEPRGWHAGASTCRRSVVVVILCCLLDVYIRETRTSLALPSAADNVDGRFDPVSHDG